MFLRINNKSFPHSGKSYFPDILNFSGEIWGGRIENDAKNVGDALGNI